MLKYYVTTLATNYWQLADHCLAAGSAVMQRKKDSRFVKTIISRLQDMKEKGQNFNFRTASNQDKNLL